MIVGPNILKLKLPLDSINFSCGVVFSFYYCFLLDLFSFHSNFVH